MTAWPANRSWLPIGRLSLIDEQAVGLCREAPNPYLYEGLEGGFQPLFIKMAGLVLLAIRMIAVNLDHRKFTLARGSRWDYTPLPFQVGIPT